MNSNFPSLISWRAQVLGAHFDIDGRQFISSLNPVNGSRMKVKSSRQDKTPRLRASLTHHLASLNGCCCCYMVNRTASAPLSLPTSQPVVCLFLMQTFSAATVLVRVKIEPNLVMAATTAVQWKSFRCCRQLRLHLRLLLLGERSGSTLRSSVLSLRPLYFGSRKREGKEREKG